MDRAVDAHRRHRHGDLLHAERLRHRPELWRLGLAAAPGFNLVRLFLYRFARLYPAFLLFALLIVMRSPRLQDLGDPAVRSYVLPHLALVQAWWPMKFEGALLAHDHFHVSWSLSVECALYLLFGLGAILAALLPRWPYRSVMAATAFFVVTWTAVEIAWTHDLRPAGWSDADWYRWLFDYSPCTVVLQFGVGVVVYRLSTLALPPRLTRAASNLGLVSLAAVYLAQPLRTASISS